MKKIGQLIDIMPKGIDLPNPPDNNRYHLWSRRNSILFGKVDWKLWKFQYRPQNPLLTRTTLQMRPHVWPLPWPPLHRATTINVFRFIIMYRTYYHTLNCPAAHEFNHRYLYFNTVSNILHLRLSMYNKWSHTLWLLSYWIAIEQDECARNSSCWLQCK